MSPLRDAKVHLEPTKHHILIAELLTKSIRNNYTISSQQNLDYSHVLTILSNLTCFQLISKDYVAIVILLSNPIC